MKSLMRNACLAIATISIWTASVQPNMASAQTSGVGADANTRLLWRNVDGSMALWNLNVNLDLFGGHVYGPYAGWAPIAITAGRNNYTYALWHFVDGSTGLWLVDPNLNFVGSVIIAPQYYWTTESLSTDTSNTNLRLLWKRIDGAVAVWNLDQSLNYVNGRVYGPYFGWNPAPVGQAIARLPESSSTPVRKMPVMARTRADAALRAKRAMTKHTYSKGFPTLPKP